MNDDMPEDAKTQINEVLFRILPGGMTIDEMEAIAIDVHRMVGEAWARAQPVEKQP